MNDSTSSEIEHIASNVEVASDQVASVTGTVGSTNYNVATPEFGSGHHSTVHSSMMTPQYADYHPEPIRHNHATLKAETGVMEPPVRNDATMGTGNTGASAKGNMVKSDTLPIRPTVATPTNPPMRGLQSSRHLSISPEPQIAAKLPRGRSANLSSGPMSFARTSAPLALHARGVATSANFPTMDPGSRRGSCAMSGTTRRYVDRANARTRTRIASSCTTLRSTESTQIIRRSGPSRSLGTSRSTEIDNRLPTRLPNCLGYEVFFRENPLVVGALTFHSLALVAGRTML
ncbi:hypothetical protein F5B20DRAFT_563229 [Whalleya microplaca]|nr:hypothetical protein F5B20DRAFT_563229 [Whalleya microplaca]